LFYFLQYLAYVCIIVALVSVLSNDAFPYPSSFYFDDVPASIVADSQIRRREVFDPYGFNSILSRFVKRDGLYDIHKRRTIHLIKQDVYEII
jgi:hypothetical protein